MVRHAFFRCRRAFMALAFIAVFLLLVTGCQADKNTTEGGELEPETSNYTWREVAGPPGQVSCMSASDPGHVWASVVVELMYHSVHIFDGAVWNEQADISLDAIDAISSDSVWGIGWDSGPGIFHFDGTSWSRQEGLAAQVDHYTDITCVGETSIWVTCINRDFRGEIVYYNGDTWKVQLVADGWISHISAADTKNVWASGKDSEGNDIIYYYNGKKWDNQGSVDGMHDISEISAADADQVWVTTPAGVFLFDGRTWSLAFQEQTVQGAGLDDEESVVNMSGVSALDSSHVWCVGSYYTPAADATSGELDKRHGIFFFNGESWNQQYVSEEQIVGVFALDCENIWCYGGKVLLFGTKAE